MRKLGYITVGVAALALVSCGKSQDPNKREPGKWKTEASLESLEFTGVPDAMKAQLAGAKDQMAAQFKSSFAREECLTAEAAAKEDVSKGLSSGLGGACEFSKKDVSSGKLDVAGTCTSAGQKMDLTMTGTLSPKKVDVVMTMKAASQAGRPGMDMKMKLTNTHVGACDS